MDMKKFVKERNEALLSLDKKKIDTYCKKYGVNMPENENVFWASVHKAILQINSASPEQKEKSRKWLIDNGFKTTM